MPEKIFRIIIFFLFLLCLRAQDTVYVRKVIRTLCSPEFHGRGYYKKGVHKAARYLVKEMQRTGIHPLFSGNYRMEFEHPVVVFHKDPRLEINGKKLEPGKTFIINPSSPPVKWDTTLSQPIPLSRLQVRKNNFFKIKNKLTWGVSLHHDEHQAGVEILSGSCDTMVHSCRISIYSRFVPRFKEYILGGFIPGKESDSMMVWCAHYDHLGRMGPSSLFPGANDNASGTSLVLELAKYFHKHPSRYTMIFLFFPAEEAGLLGSRFFCEHPPLNLKKIKFLINLDLLGTGEEGIMVVNGTEFPHQFSIMTDINKEKNYLKEIRKRGPAANSDHYWFYKNGVPCFFIYTLGGVSFYHDIYDRWQTLPLSKYSDVFRLLVDFTQHL